MSLSFNGTSAYLSCATTPFPTGAHPRSVVAWVKPSSTAANNTVFVSYRDTSVTLYYQLRVNGTTGYIQGGTRNDTTNDYSIGTTAISTSGWSLVHCAWDADGIPTSGLHDGSNTSGAYASAGTGTVEPAFTPTAMRIGMRPVNLDWFVGLIALVAVYDKAPSDSELDELYSTQPESATTSGNLVAYWDFRDNDAELYNDHVGAYDLSNTDTTFDAENPTLGTGASPYVVPIYSRLSQQNTLLRM